MTTKTPTWWLTIATWETTCQTCETTISAEPILYCHELQAAVRCRACGVAEGIDPKPSQKYKGWLYAQENPVVPVTEEPEAEHPGWGNCLRPLG